MHLNRSSGFRRGTTSAGGGVFSTIGKGSCVHEEQCAPPMYYVIVIPTMHPDPTNRVRSRNKTEMWAARARNYHNFVLY